MDHLINDKHLKICKILIWTQSFLIPNHYLDSNDCMWWKFTKWSKYLENGSWNQWYSKCFKTWQKCFTLNNTRDLYIYQLFLVNEIKWRAKVDFSPNKNTPVISHNLGSWQIWAHLETLLRSPLKLRKVCKISIWTQPFLIPNRAMLPKFISLYILYHMSKMSWILSETSSWHLDET